MQRQIATLFVAGIFAVAASASAQEITRIAAIVNDDVVSVYDLNARMKLITATLGLEETPELRRRLKPQVMRGLIDERLRMQEAKRRNISVSKRNLRKAIGLVSAQNKIPADKFENFLTSRNIPVETVLDQLKSEIVWSKLVSRRLRSRISVSDEEIDEILSRIKSRQGQTEFLLSEIYLAVDSPDQERSVHQSAIRLIEQIRSGVEFSTVARQFSQNSSAAAGGKLGWIHESALENNIRAVVTALKSGETSNPIASVSAFRIIRVDRKRQVATSDPGDTALRLHRLILPLSPQAGKADIDAQVGLANIMAETISGCDDIARAAKEAKSPGNVDLGKLRLRDLSPAIRKAVSDLPTGKPSQPVRTPEGVLLLMVCQRQEPKSALPGRKEIEQRLIMQRLGMMARRYLRDLRNAAVIDLRV